MITDSTINRINNLIESINFEKNSYKTIIEAKHITNIQGFILELVNILEEIESSLAKNHDFLKGDPVITNSHNASSIWVSSGWTNAGQNLQDFINQFEAYYQWEQTNQGQQPPPEIDPGEPPVSIIPTWENIEVANIGNMINNIQNFFEGRPSVYEGLMLLGAFAAWIMLSLANAMVAGLDSVIRARFSPNLMASVFCVMEGDD